MKKGLLALLMGTSLVLAACGGGDGAKDTAADTPDAEKLYGQKCAACHAADLSGGVGFDLTKVGAKLTKEQIETVILQGQNQNTMPKELLTGKDASAVAEWLAAKK